MFRGRRVAFWLIVLVLVILVGATVMYLLPEHRVLTYVLPADALNLDPLKADDTHSWKVVTQIYEGLTKFRPNSTKVEFNLAKDVEVSDDGLAYTFYLQRNVQFQDCTPFNADAVVWNVERALKLRQDYYYADLVWGNVKSVEKIGDYVVRIWLHHPDPGFLVNLALPLGGSMVSPNAKDPSKDPVGTGPYRLKSWSKGKSMVLELNPNWWQRGLNAPYFRQIRFVVESEPEKAFSMIKSGKADILGYVSPAQLPELYKQPELEVVTFSGLMTSYIGFNTKSPRLADVRVREALSLLLDRNVIVDHTYKGTAVVATGPLPLLLDHEIGCRGIASNPNKAVEILSSLGFTKEKPLRIVLEIPLEPRPYMSMGGRVLGEDIKKQLEASGLVKVQVLYTPVDQMIADLRQGLPDAFLLGWGSDNAQVDNFLRPLFYSTSPLNFFRYSSKEVDSYLDQALWAADPMRRRALYKLACDKIMEDVPAVFLAYPYSYRVVHVGLSGFNANALEIEYLWMVKPSRL